MALPWAASAMPVQEDRLRDAAANLALLGAARALTLDEPNCQRDPIEVVTEAIREMTPEGRLESARRMAIAQERIFQALLVLKAKEGPVTAADVRDVLSASQGASDASSLYAAPQR